jgi:hypothetical protein
LTVWIRIDWLGTVCSCSRQEGLGRSIFGGFSFVFKGIMARMDLGGWGSATHGEN